MPWLPFRLMEFEIKKPVGSLARFQQASTGGKFGLTPIVDCHNEPFSLTVKSVHSKYGINNKKSRCSFPVQQFSLKAQIYEKGAKKSNKAKKMGQVETKTRRVAGVCLEIVVTNQKRDAEGMCLDVA